MCPGGRDPGPGDHGAPPGGAAQARPAHREVNWRICKDLDLFSFDVFVICCSQVGGVALLPGPGDGLRAAAGAHFLRARFVV